MAKIIFSDGEEIIVDDGSPLESPCEEAGIPFACPGGICGSCIVEIKDGMENLSEPSQAEINFLGKEGVKKERMACQCTIEEGSVTIAF